MYNIKCALTHNHSCFWCTMYLSHWPPWKSQHPRMLCCCGVIVSQGRCCTNISLPPMWMASGLGAVHGSDVGHGRSVWLSAVQYGLCPGRSHCYFPLGDQRNRHVNTMTRSWKITRGNRLGTRVLMRKRVAVLCCSLGVAPKISDKCQTVLTLLTPMGFQTKHFCCCSNCVLTNIQSCKIWLWSL